AFWRRSTATAPRCSWPPTTVRSSTGCADASSNCAKARSSATSKRARTESPHEGRLHPLRGLVGPAEELLDGRLRRARDLRLPALRRRRDPAADAGRADEGLLVRPRAGLSVPVPVGLGGDELRRRRGHRRPEGPDPGGTRKLRTRPL